MRRKRVTELFPWILPLRKKQRCLCFYAGMALDRRRYAKLREELTLPHIQYQTSSLLYNKDTRFDMKYQENKVFNLHLAAKMLDGLLIRPGETFSFWKTVHHADREKPYKEGLTVIDGTLMTTSGGGLCQMSVLLFMLFLHSPLVITERKGHRKKEFPDPGSQMAGTDATISEGWIDLKVENKTEETYQIRITFDEERIYGFLRTEKEPQVQYEIFNRAVRYCEKDQGIYQIADVYRRSLEPKASVLIGEQKLYENCCKIEYSLPECVVVEKE